MILGMKRLVLIFLLAVLPFQFSWAAAAAYCQHDGEKTVQHFGHHTHQHDAQTDTPNETEPGVKFHSDCGYCHLFGQAPFVMTALTVAVETGGTQAEALFPRYSSHIPDGLQRPDWRLVA